MSFLDNNGLSYFYNKIKEKFVRSINSKTPDSSGNVDITNVATADNLTSPDAQASYDYFIYRTSGGSASLSSGEAQLVYVDGNMEISGRVPESFDIITNNNVTATYSAATWKSYLSDPNTGTYLFNYTAPTSSTPTSSSWTNSGTWAFTPPGGSATSGINPETYGIYVSNVINPSVSVSSSGSGITGATVTPDTWFGAVTESGTYVFTYSSTALSWQYDDTNISLNTYGLVVSGSAAANDTITVTTVVGTPNSTVRVDYTKYNPGTIIIPTPATFSATGFNHFDKATMYIADATISGGKITSNAGTYICYCRCTPASESGWAAYSDGGDIRGIGWCATTPTIGADVTTTGVDYSTILSTVPVTADGYVVVATVGMDDLMIHPRWSGAADNPQDVGYDSSYVAYTAPSTITIPTEDVEETDLPTATWGMAAVGAVADRLNLDAGTYIQKVDRLANTTSNMSYVVGLDMAYEYDDNYIYYVLPSPITYTVDIDPVYIVNDWGTEEFIGTTVAVGAQTLYGQNLRDKLRTDVLTISEQQPPLTKAQTNQVYENLSLNSFHLSGTITELPYIIEDSRITAKSGVCNVVLGTPASIKSDLLWTTSDGSVKFSGTLGSGETTTIAFDIAPIITATGSWSDTVTPDSGTGYCKLPDGTLIQWMTEEYTGVKMNTQWGTGQCYYSSQLTLPNWSIAFNSTPTITASVTGANDCFLGKFSGTSTTFPGRVYPYSPVSVTNKTISINVIGIGRWK